ncbi:transposable element Tcb2 transposase [Trichonephila clavipes]|nr:transposable element Tcb2 transposase [Trichonephila clavipes]
MQGKSIKSLHSFDFEGLFNSIDIEDMIKRHIAPSAGVLVGSPIAYNTRSPLVFVHRTMTDERYVHEILQPHVLPLMQRLPEAIFQQDNAWRHTARVSQECLLTVTSLPWPARSPDVSYRANLGSFAMWSWVLYEFD